MVECFQDSEILPCLLGIVLAVGNYLNGGGYRTLKAHSELDSA